MKRLFFFTILFSLLFSQGHTQNPLVQISTEMGTIDLEIYEKKAPVTAKHFLANVDHSVFKDACFYRVVRLDNQAENKVKIEVVQGGLFHDSIVDQMPVIVHETTKETGILHTNGVVSMARLEPGSASTEFFICIGNQPELDYGGKRNPDGQGFAAFGKVIKGMNLIRAIQQQKTKGQFLIKPIEIRSIKRK